MPGWVQAALSILGGVVLVWLVLVLVLWVEQRRHPGRASLVDLLRLAPDVVRLLRRLATDRAVPVGVRMWLGVLLVYLVSPIDLIPTSSRSWAIPTTLSLSRSRCGLRREEPGATRLNGTGQGRRPV